MYSIKPLAISASLLLHRPIPYGTCTVRGRLSSFTMSPRLIHEARLFVYLRTVHTSRLLHVFLFHVLYLCTYAEMGTSVRKKSLLVW